ncbi:hypothetical protein [Nitrosomonas sp. Nm34]|uniref:hypothetical protein n=1 Tax=Nitrosomonas sp. Nm34 TaxID=1881055 RepID=UPI0008ED1C22|nr:hypothetical protein [Nitrosomonas sp. Nm34]SFI60956.1 hypothetical protein SAMN05428978_10202 [Nitrosomonas sp. Nm34]
MQHKQKAKQTTKPDANEYPRKALECRAGNNADQTGRNYADLITSPEVAAYRVINACEDQQVASKIDVPGLVATLRNQAETTNKNDLSQAEAMLMNQAVALQSIFVRLTEKALNQESLSSFDTMMKLALKAQSQCRTTIEALSTIKNPPVVFAKQANITHGHQQINNGTATALHARENQIQQNELLKDNHETVDSRAASATSLAHSSMETLGEINRSKNS